MRLSAFDAMKHISCKGMTSLEREKDVDVFYGTRGADIYFMNTTNRDRNARWMM